MSTINARNQFLKAVCALALLANTHGALASNNPLSSTPEGFGKETTGGAGGEVVTVTTKEQLAYQLCRTMSAGYCSDNTPRIIKISGAIDFTGSEKRAQGRGCSPYITACTAPRKSESLVLVDSNDQHCLGKPITMIDYDKAGTTPLLVGSNKTLIGLNNDAGMKGKGLRLNKVQNVVIRNLTFSDINQGIVFAGDAIMIENADKVWIDHNRFHNIGRQMIAAGFGATTNITISWNKFDGDNDYSPYCNGQHYWNLLLEGRTQTITLSNNWFHNISGRAPHVEAASAKIHMVNNYFQNDEYLPGYGFLHALEAGINVNVLVEGNYFSNIATPILQAPGAVFASLGGPTVATQNLCKETMMRNCYGNIAKPAPMRNHFAQDGVVMKTAFKSVPKYLIVLPYTASDVPANVKANAGPGNL